MIRKHNRLALLGITFVCAALLAACNDTPRLQFITVAPVSGEIYVSAQPAGGIRGAARSHIRPALQGSGNTGRRPAITIQPVTATCGSLQYAATGLLSNGSTKDLTSTATWTSSSTSVATVNSSGLASGIGLGTTNIGANFNGVTATSEPLGVDQLNSITVSPSPATVPQGSSVQFTAIGNFTFAAGGTSDLDVSSQVTWASSNTAVATVDNTGNATAVAPGGPINITATSCDGIMVGTATLIVGAAAPQSLQISPAAPTINTGTTTLFTAVELLSDGTTQPLTGAVTWTSGTTTTATVDLNTGVALGLAVGKPSTITATEAGTGFTGTATLTVQAAAARFAYIANLAGNGTPPVGGPGSISGYTVDVAGGTLTPLTGSPFAASNPQQVLVHPSGDLLYYIDSGSSIQTDFVDSGKSGNGGALTASGRQPSLAGTGGTNVGVIDPLGRFIYVIDDGTSTNNSPTFTPTIYGFSIAQTNTQSTNGVLTAITAVTAFTDGTLNVPSWVMTDRAGKFLYVVNSGNSTISEYSIDQSSGALTSLNTVSTPPIATGASPNYATTDVKGHIYVANSGDGTVSVFSIDSTTGLLTQVGSSNFAVTSANTVFNVLTDPTGK